MPRDGTQIGSSETKSLRKRAQAAPIPRDETPASANIGGGDASDLDGTMKVTTPINLPSRPGNTSEIGEAVTPTRRGKAKVSATPNATTRSSAPTEATEKKPRRKRAMDPSSTIRSVPASESIGPVSNGETGGDGQDFDDTQIDLAIPAQTDAQIAVLLVQKQSVRRHCIKTKNKLASSVDALIAQQMGYRIDATEKERKALFARATAYRVAVERGGEGQMDSDNQSASALAALRPTIMLNAATSGPYLDLRKKIEKEMEDLASKLSLAPFAKAVRGFGELGLAVMQAEAGIPISEYRTVSGLWKRLGLAVIGGRRQRRVTDKEQAILHGYSPKRRAEVYAFLSDTMLKGQWNGPRLQCVECNAKCKFTIDKKSGLPICEKCSMTGESSDIIAAHAAGPYGEVYGRRKAATTPRIAATADLDAKDPNKWTGGRVENDARRIMSKALLRDLWRAGQGLPPRGLADEG